MRYDMSGEPVLLSLSSPRPRPLLALRLAAPLLAAIALFSSGCSGISGKVDFRCGPAINGGLLLTVDVIRATEAETQQIQQQGEKWFYNDMRFALRNRVQTITFPAPDGQLRCDRTIVFEPIKGREERDLKNLVVIADYKYQTPNPTGYIVVLPRDRWQGKTITVSVQDRELTVVTP